MSTPAPATRHTFTSMFANGQVTVLLDPWAANPLLDDALQSVPPAVQAAQASNGDAPTMFITGDRPPFTASGVDPQYLELLPWRCRHAAAAEPRAAVVLGWVEQYASAPDAELPSPGLEEYIVRFRDWLAGRWTNPAFNGADSSQVDAADGAVFDALFGTKAAQLDQAAASSRASAAAFDATRNGYTAIGRAQR